jgi:hypothetical protein
MTEHKLARALRWFVGKADAAPLPSAVPPTREFSVVEYYDDDRCAYVERWLDPESAFKLARRCADAAMAASGLVARVIILDGEDFTVFEWKFGEGVTFPKKGEDAVEAVE